jgi:hypothetical protein
MILVSEEAARWLLNAAQRDPARLFSSFEPYACKLCDERVPPSEPVHRRSHLRGHQRELDNAAATRRRESLRSLKQANRLRREAARV